MEITRELKVSFKKTHHRSSQPTCSWLRCISFPNENVCYIFKKHKHDKVSHLSKLTHLLLEFLCLQHRAVVCNMPSQNVIFNGFSVDNKRLMRCDVRLACSKDAVLLSVFPWRYQRKLQPTSLHTGNIHTPAVATSRCLKAPSEHKLVEIKSDLVSKSAQVLFENIM